jgi:lysophospholipase L1-like esterase/dienelactone hydrolase
MKLFAVLTVVLLSLFSSFSSLGNAIVKVVCVGASITEGVGAEPRKEMSFPAQLQVLLGNGYVVSNYGVSACTMIRKGNKPYWNTKQYQEALASLPDIVVIDLGGNDSKLVNRPYLDEYAKDCREMVDAFRALPSHPRVILLAPIPSFQPDTTQLYSPVMKKTIIPQLQRVAYEAGVEVIDMHSLFVDKANLVPDKIHPNNEGAGIYAKRLLEVITAKKDMALDVFKGLPTDKSISSFYGYPCADFVLNGKKCKVVKPKWAATGHPYIWRARFWGHEPQADIALLERGFHVVYCDVAELFGNAEAIAAWDGFYALLRKAGLGKKAVLEGMSRGGVYAFNWAAANPAKVAAVYVDNPVLDLKTWPAGLGKVPVSKNEFEQFKADYKLTTDEQVRAFKGSPMDKVPAIVKGKYPILILCADADEAVAPEDNTYLFEGKVKALKGNITVIHKPGMKHHPHSLPNPTVIVDFIVRACKLQ